MQRVDEAEQLGVFVPPMPKPGMHHVISKGRRPDFYRPQDLRDIGPGKTLWVDAFEKILVGLYWATGAPVPYAFRTPDGAIRSLDAGCIKMLLNRTPPELILSRDLDGFIDTVLPSEPMLDRYKLIKEVLVKRIMDAWPD